MPSFANFAAPPPLQRLVDDQIDTGTSGDKSFDNEQEQLATHR
jgi:hypothetical protein